METTTAPRTYVAPVIDPDTEWASLEEALAGIDTESIHHTEEYASADFFVGLKDGQHLIIELKSRDYPLSFFQGNPPLVDAGKIGRLVKMAGTRDARAIVIQETSDHYLIGFDASDVLEHGDLWTGYQRKKGNRSQDKRKSVYVVPLEHCQIRPPHWKSTPGDDVEWLAWLSPQTLERHTW